MGSQVVEYLPEDQCLPSDMFWECFANWKITWKRSFFTHVLPICSMFLETHVLQRVSRVPGPQSFPTPGAEAKCHGCTAHATAVRCSEPDPMTRGE